MSRISFRPSSLLVLAVFFLTTSFSALADSNVRIVRLSYIEGNVQIDRGTGQFEKAMVNLPISQGTRLQTGSEGRAEVEFEDGSTIRIVPDSAIEFPRLSLRDSGAKVSQVELNRGTAYVDYDGKKDDEFTIQFSRETVRLERSAHLRVGINDEAATLAVFKGDVQVDGASGNGQLKKGQTGNFDLANNDSFTLAKNIGQEPFDNWDKQQNEFHSRYASNSYGSYSPYAYGTADLSYYGNFFNAPGYGMLWQPYFVGAGWDPFMNGAWAYNPGWGFGWVSAYPWGWTPYHYGTWIFLPSYGWAWEPGGTWMPWYAQPRIMNPPRGFIAPQSPSTGRSMVVVNRGPVSTFQSGNRVVIRNNSAGLGVRRGEIKNLAKASQQVQQRGTVTERVHTVPVSRPAPSYSGMDRDMTRRGAMSPAGGRSSGPSPSISRAPARSPAPSMSPGPASAPAPRGGGGGRPSR